MKTTNHKNKMHKNEPNGNDYLSLGAEKRTLIISSLIGVSFLVLAIYLAHKHKRKFWGYVGYIFLAGMVSTPLSIAISVATITKKDVVSTTQEPAAKPSYPLAKPTDIFSKRREQAATHWLDNSEVL